LKHRIHSAPALAVDRGEPTECLRRWSGGAGGDDGLLLVDFELSQYWLEGGPPVSLTAIYLRCGGDLKVAVTDRTLVARALPPDEQFEHWVAEHRLFAASPGDPLPLLPLRIPKPWGHEIWYTGVEARGVCRAGGSEASVPIPWLQAVLPDRAAGEGGRSLVLLKILDPSPDEVTGDLYFELHEAKREVYVVTRIDPEAWPGGVGYIRYGFDPDRVAAATSGEQFRRDYLATVRAYEAVRRELDAGAGNPALLERERVLRSEMDAFTHMRPLEVGDVVVVPLLMPHSLQHGVRTVEFQTPVYERLILSFGQRVLTQGHWDTERAVAMMRLLPPDLPEFECLERREGLVMERIVDFPDFEVHRARVEAGAVLEISRLAAYGLVMVIDGSVVLGGARFGPEQALLLPRGWSGRLGPAESERHLILLLAVPRA
jgi:hypothetical protein